MKRLLYVAVALLLSSCRLDGYSYQIRTEVLGSWVRKTVYIHYEGFAGASQSPYLITHTDEGPIDQAQAIDSSLQHWADSTIIIFKKNHVQ